MVLANAGRKPLEVSYAQHCTETVLCGSGSGRISNFYVGLKVIPDPGSSGSEMNLKQNCSDKLIKFDNFSTKCSILKLLIIFKNHHNKLISRRNMQPNVYKG
jgi:hypothetical protein